MRFDCVIKQKLFFKELQMNIIDLTCQSELEKVEF